MRTVNIFKLERREEEKVPGVNYTRTYLERVPDGTGMFHGWGVDCVEDAGTYTTAIIETPDGTVVTPAASMIQFTSPA